VTAARARPPVLLVVDDHDDSRELLVAMLGALGFDTRTAATGRQALAAAREEVPRLILLDLMMPDMDGVVFRTVQERDPTLADLPVLIVSAHPDAESIARRLGAAGVLRKPVSLAELKSVIQRLCGEAA
jgi:CheY-like chemotaxis protein